MDDKPINVQQTRPTEGSTSLGVAFQQGLIDGGYHIPASLVGIPVDLVHFGLTRLSAHTGNWFTVDKKDTILSSEWNHGKLMAMQRGYEKMVGIKPVEIAPDSPADTARDIGKLTAIGASFFIPNPLSKASDGGRALTTLEKIRSNFGVQINAAELVTLPAILAEKALGITYTTGSTSKVLHASPAAPQPVADKSATGTTITPSGSVRPVGYSPAVNSKILASIMTGSLRASDSADGFNQTAVKAIQTELVKAGLLKPTPTNPNPVDGTLGVETAKGIDASIRRNINPQALTDDLKASYKDRMTSLSKELKATPPTAYNFDPRVIELQVCGYALGVYKGKIDGLHGDLTKEAITGLDTLQSSKQPIVAKAESKGPDRRMEPA